MTLTHYGISLIIYWHVSTVSEFTYKMGIHLKPDTVDFNKMSRSLPFLFMVAVIITDSSGLRVRFNCRNDEEYHSCGNLLSPTCTEPDLNNFFISLSDCMPQCVCRDGLVRLAAASTQCIPLTDCPKKML